VPTEAWGWLCDRAAEEILDPDAFDILGHVLRATGSKPEMIS